MAYTTAANVRAYMSTAITADDTLLASLIARATAIIEEYVGFTFEAGADTERTFDAKRDVDGLTLVFDKWLADITTVTNGNGVEVASTDYVTEPRNDAPYYAIRLKPSSGLVWEYDDNNDPEDAITVEGRWGWSTSVPADIEHATIRLVSWMYHQRNNQTETDRTIIADGVVITPASMPRDILDTLNKYKRRV
jgi:hypothetical protein